LARGARHPLRGARLPGRGGALLHVEAEEGEAPGDFEPGKLAVLLRQDGYGLRAVRGETPDDDRRLEVRFGNDVLITVASKDGQSYQVCTPLRDLVRGCGVLTRRYPIRDIPVAFDAEGTAVLSTAVKVESGGIEERLRHAIGGLGMEALGLLYPIEDTTD